jgi:hypothetical protein
METTIKRLKVTFSDGLPLGTHASFTHEGERWIAVPLAKYNSVLAVTDRLIGVLGRVRGALTHVIGAFPSDAQQIGRILDILAIADTDGLARDKAKAQTS